LKHIGKLPNPDPSDTEPWDEAAEAKQVITIDPAFEAARGDLRKQAQQWANLTVDPNANLFVFVGRWSVQKGVDLIADVFPSVLEKHPDVQLICVGPVIDLYGKFAALKLEAIMKKYPGRVYSKPEFTQLPPYIFSGAEFALIPSRDEPFGLVAVEFGRKGALGVGARVGGLGQMPGWWYTVESTTSKHLIQQFKSAINDALASSIEVRADMRARSAKQRFPVARWVEDLEALHGASIRLHQAGTTSGKASARRSDPTSGLLGRAANENANPYGLSSFELDAQGSRGSSRERAAQAPGSLGRTLSLGNRVGPGHRRPADSNDHLSRVAEGGDDAEVEISSEDAEAACRIENVQEALSSLEGRQPGWALLRPTAGLSIGGDHGPRGRAKTHSPKFSISAPGTNEALSISPTVGMQSNKRSRSSSLMASAPTSLLSKNALRPSRRQRSTSLLSLHEVTSGRLDYSLQKVDLDFTDSQGEYYRKFEELLQQKFTAKSSENTLVIEDFLQASEKEWGARYRAERLGGPRSTSVAASDHRHSSPRASSDTRRASSSRSYRDSAHSTGSSYSGSALDDEFLLGENYARPHTLKRWLQIRIFDWPIYCILLALGQIMAANSYQIVLLTGGSGAGQTEKLYIIGGIYIVASCLWWMMYRTMSPRFVTSVPFAIYGLGFILVGLAPLIGNIVGRQWARNVAAGMYAMASASGSLYFALNFGDEGESLCTRNKFEMILTSNRRRSHPAMGLPSLHRPRHPTNLHRRPLLLGPSPERNPKQTQHQRPQNNRRQAHPSRHSLPNRRPLPRNRSPPLHLSPILLPPNPRQNPLLLQISAPPQTHRLDARLRRPAKLLPLNTLRPQLGLPLELKVRAAMGHRCPGGNLLRRNLDGDASGLRPAEQIPLLDPAYIRFRAAGAALGANVVGNVVVWPVAALDAWRSGRRCDCGSRVVALAGSS
jgi:alpha-1,3-glucan synthase